jgi:CRISPR-associated endoribonuclease Cas6
MRHLYSRADGLGVDIVGVIASSPLESYQKYSSGFSIRGLFYRILKVSDAVLAYRIHESRGLAPFSASPLIRLEDGIYYFRYASFDSRITRALLEYFKKNDEVKLFDTRFHVSEVTFKTIDLKKLLQESNSYDKYEVEFISPTCFRRPCPYIPLHTLGFISMMLRVIGRPKSTYRYYPLPDPVLMLRNICRLWREYDGVTIKSRKYTRWLEEGGVALSGVENIRTVKLLHRRGKAFIVGFIGKARLSLPHDTYSEEYARVTNALLRLGEETQVGVNRTAGFGMYRILKMLE